MGLPVYTGGDKPAAGTVIEGRRIESTLDLSAGNITIDRSCIRPTRAAKGLPIVTTTDYDRCVGDVCPTAPNPVTLKDCEIDGSAVDTATIAFSSAFMGIGTVQRCDIHDVGSGIAIYNAGDHIDATVTGNYVHNLRAWGNGATNGSHTDGITIRDFTTTRKPDRTALIADNRVDCSSGNDTGALFIQTADDIDNVTVRNNLLEGDGYQLTLEARFGNVYGKSMSAIDNRFSGTGYGPATVTRGGVSHGWTTWTNNFINDPRAADNKGRAVGSPG